MNPINDQKNTKQSKTLPKPKKASKVVSGPGVLTRSAARRLSKVAVVKKAEKASEIIKTHKTAQPVREEKAAIAKKAPVAKSRAEALDGFIRDSLEAIKKADITNEQLCVLREKAIYYRNLGILNIKHIKFSEHRVNKVVTLSEIVLRATQLLGCEPEKEEAALDALMIAETYGGVRFIA